MSVDSPSNTNDKPNDIGPDGEKIKGPHSVLPESNKILTKLTCTSHVFHIIDYEDMTYYELLGVRGDATDIDLKVSIPPSFQSHHILPIRWLSIAVSPLIRPTTFFFWGVCVCFLIIHRKLTAKLLFDGTQTS
jgi:hypothetical protein